MSAYLSAPHDTNTRVISRAKLAARALQIAGLALAYGTLAAVSALIATLVKGRVSGSCRFFRAVVNLIERLGPTFVKFGQIMSCRRDVLPERFCEALSVLHASVHPISQADVRRALEQAYGGGPGALFRYEDLALLASGSIAGVFRAVSRSGQVVALKIRRPAIEQVMRRDLAIMERMARMAERLPNCKGMPLGNLVGYVSIAILGQLDFDREADNLARIHKSLSAIANVRVPAPIPELSAPGCLAMEFIPGLDARTLETLSLNEREALADTALTAVRQLMFIDGFTHCDLHPGNLYATPSGELVILDAGFSANLPENVRTLMGEFFFSMLARRGARCAEIIIESAAHIRPGTDLSGFVTAVSELVEKQSHESVFSMMAFGNHIFELQQKFGLYAESDFAFPMMSLAVLEGTVRRLNPRVNLQQLGRPTPLMAQTVAV